MKSLLILALAIALTAVGAFLFRSYSTHGDSRLIESAAAPEARQATTESGGAVKLAAVSSVDVGRDEAAVQGEESPAVAPAQQVEADTEVAASTGGIKGTLLVKRQDGTEDAVAAGELTFLFWRGNSGSHEKVTVSEGHFELVVPSDDGVERVTLREAIVEGRPMKVEAPLEDASIDLSGPCRVIVQEPAQAVLEVMEIGTESHLSEICLVSAPRFPRGSVVVPSARAMKKPLAKGLQSPVELGPYLNKSRDHDLLVGAEGYEWTRVRVRPLQGGLQRVELMRSGDLTVEVTGVDPSAASLLRARRAGTYGPLVEVYLAKDGPIELSGLRPATYTLTAEVGDHWDSPIQLGTSEVVVMEGLAQRVLLTLEAAPTAETATLSGEVHVAESWGVEKPLLIMKLLDTPLGGFEEYQRLKPEPMPSKRPGFDSFKFTKPKLQVGRYSVYLHEPNVPVGVDLPPEGISDFELVMGEPVQLIVRVVERSTGEAVDTDQLSWNVKRPAGTSGGSMDHADFDEALGAYVILAPERPVELMLWTWEFLPYQGEVDLSTGVREHTIEVERAAGFILRLVDERGDEVLFPENWEMAIEPVDGSGTMSLRSHGSEFARALVTEPGDYTIQIPEIPGFVQPEPYLLKIEPGEMLEARAVLQRQ